MPPRVPKSRRVKRVSANAVQTQPRRGSKRKTFPSYYDETTQPSYFEASDPDNPSFDPRWHKKSLIPDADPWHSIVLDFYDGKTTIEGLLKDKFELRQHITMDQVESLRPFDVAEIALGWAYSLIPEIEKKLSFKVLDADFLLLWGEFQKNIGIPDTLFLDTLQKVSNSLLTEWSENSYASALTDVDRFLIRTLYDDRIKPGMTVDQIINVTE